MLRSPNCFKFVADAEFLPNQRGTYRSGRYYQRVLTNRPAPADAGPNARLGAGTL